MSPALGAGKGEHGQVLDELDELSETEEVDLLVTGQEEEREQVFTLDMLKGISYATICDQNQMMNSDKLVLMKSLVNFDYNQPVKLKLITTQVTTAIKQYIMFLQSFVLQMRSQIENVELLAPRYLNLKLNVLVSHVYDVLDKERQTLHDPIIGDPVKEKVGNENIAFSLIQFKAELLNTPKDFNYLVGAKTQVFNQKDDPDFENSVPPFLAELPKILTDILRFLIQNKKNNDIKKTYIANFFDVFAQLLPRQQVVQLILDELTPTRKDNFKPQHKSPTHPQVLRDPKTFNFPVTLDMVPYHKIIGTDKLLSHDDPITRNVEKLVGLHTPVYSLHPEWLPFFDIDEKQKTGKIPVTDASPEIIEEAHRFIYFFYVSARKQGQIEPEETDPRKIAETLYKNILTTKCYDEDECKLTELVPERKFSTHYLIMLALLKPFTGEPDNFNQEDVGKIVEKSARFGAEAVERHMPKIIDSFPGLKKQTIALKTEQLEDDLRKLLPPVMKAKAEEADQDPITIRVNRKKAKDEAMPHVINTLKTNHPKLDTIPRNEKDVKDFLDEIDQITDVVLETPPELGSLVLTALAKQLQDLIEDQQIEQAKNDQIREGGIEPDMTLEPKPKDYEETGDKEEEGAKKQGQIHLIEENANMLRVKRKLNNWSVKQTLANLAMTDTHPFIKYLDNTINRRLTQMQNSVATFYPDIAANYLHAYDLYVFVYQAHLQFGGKNKGSESIQNLEARLATIGLDLEAMSTDMQVFKFAKTFEFMTAFLKMFDLFETHHTKVGEEVANYGATYDKVFDQLYMFMAEVRLRAADTHEEPSVAAFRELTRCMTRQYDRVIHDMEIPDAVWDGSQYEEGSTEEYDAYMDWMLHHECHQSYAQMSDFYYFFLIQHADNKEILKMHDDLFVGRWPINTHHLYNYLIEADNEFKHAYTDYCNHRNGEHFCFGFDVYRNIREQLVKGANKNGQGLTVVATLIQEKLRTLTLPGVTLNDPTDMQSLRVTFWNIICGLVERGPQMTNSYGTLDMLISTNGLSKAALQMDVDPNDEVSSKILAEFLALRFNHMPFTTASLDQITAAVEGFMDTRSRVNYHIYADGIFQPPNARFLVQFTKKFAHFKEISRIIIQTKSVEHIIRWIDTFPENLDNLKDMLVGREEFSDKVNAVDTFLAERVKKRALDVKNITKAPVPGQRPAPKGKNVVNKKEVTASSTTSKVEEPKMSPSQQAKLNPSSASELRKASDKISSAFGGMKGPCMQELEEKVLYSGFQTRNMEQIDPKTVKNALGGSTSTMGMVVVEGDKSPVDLTIHAVANKLIIEKEFAKERLENERLRLRRLRVVV